MGIAKAPSVVTMPKAETPHPSILDFLSRRFPAISLVLWEKRISEGKVLDENSQRITLDTKYAPQRRIYYFREVDSEPTIPFAEKILFLDDHILVACKPHFLPMTPSGQYVDECLLNRLKRCTGIEALTPLHRIDRETAGIALFSVNRTSTGLYGNLFRNGHIEKTYQALSACPPNHLSILPAISWLCLILDVNSSSYSFSIINNLSFSALKVFISLCMSIIS